MNPLLSFLDRWLFSRPHGAFGVMLLFNSYLLLVYQDSYTWEAYLSQALLLIPFYTPALVFSSAWPRIQVWPKAWQFLLWAGIFLIFPLLLAVIPFSEEFKSTYFPDPPLPVWIMLSASLILFTEMALRSSDFLRQRAASWQWWTKQILERVILLLLFITAMVIAGRHIWLQLQETGNSGWLAALPRFLGYTFQFFLLNLITYFFYYINHYYLIPRILKPKGVIYYGFSIAGVILIFYPILSQLAQFLPMLDELNIQMYSQLFPEDRGAAPLLVILFSTPFIVGIDWFKQNSDISNLEKEKTRTELNLLKQQINPHFFFNTLNNLYALSLTKDEATPEVILRLSDQMRYVIYKGKETSVSLGEEIQYLEDYIQLQQMRLHQQLDLQFTKTITDPNTRIPPLLLITLVENAFKHGIEPAEGPASLHIDLKADERQLKFVCTNSVESPSGKPPGIGLTNLRRRLDLLFPNKHQLHLNNQPHSFTAKLELEI